MIARDKKVHFAVGALFGFAGGWVAWFFIWHAYFPTLLAALGLATFVGICKELYDINKTGFDKMDLLATALGGLAATILWAGVLLLPNVM